MYNAADAIDNDDDDGDFFAVTDNAVVVYSSSMLCIYFTVNFLSFSLSSHLCRFFQFHYYISTASQMSNLNSNICDLVCECVYVCVMQIRLEKGQKPTKIHTEVDVHETDMYTM